MASLDQRISSPFCLTGGKAAELYYFSILDKPAPAVLEKEIFLGMAKAGKSSKAFHQHLLNQGFQRRPSGRSAKQERPAYFREDLGYLEIRCPEKPGRKTPYKEGLGALPDPWMELLLEDPHSVELKYLGESYTVRIPQTGRFILVQGLQTKGRKRTTAEENYQASQCLVRILYLLVRNEELEEETLNDLLEVKPNSLLMEFQKNLREQGPGSPVWEGARKLYSQMFPGTNPGKVDSWYWGFLSKLGKALKEREMEKGA